MIVTVTMNAAIDKLYMVEQMEPCTVMRVKKVNNTAGGKGLNVTKVAAKLGEKVTATGIIGGHMGEFFRSLIPKENITPMFTTVQGELRSCINIIDLSTGSSTEYLEPGLHATDEDLQRFLQDYKKAIQPARVVTISGSTVQGTPEDFYTKLISIAKEDGKKVLLDTSGQRLRDGVDARPAMVKPNTDEIKHLYPQERGEIDPVEAAVDLHERGIEMAVVSLGKEGMIAACDQGVYRGIAPTVDTKSAVGSGDCVMAAFAVGLMRNYTVEKTLKLALAVSAANASIYETGDFREEDVKRLLTEVRVEKI